MRKKIELSRAVKLPTIGLQLAGCKKIQQLLTIPEVLNEFLPKPLCQKIAQTFIGTFELNPSTEEFKTLYNKVKSRPGDYVLKPQREGGGNNIYGDQIIEILDKGKMEPSILGSYILMEMIRPTVYNNYLVLPDMEKAIPIECISELGSWGVYVFSDNGMLHNLPSGYLLRTKPINELDGGVASGRAVLDSACFF